MNIEMFTGGEQVPAGMSSSALLPCSQDTQRPPAQAKVVLVFQFGRTTTSSDAFGLNPFKHCDAKDEHGVRGSDPLPGRWTKLV